MHGVGVCVCVCVTSCEAWHLTICSQSDAK